MTFLAPIWLCLLLPWAAVCLWASRRSQTAARVPFIGLWPRTAVKMGARHRPPPVWLICLLAGVLLAILAAAGLAYVRDAVSITIVVDRSPGMTAERLKAAEANLALPASAVRHVVPVPGVAFDTVGPVDWHRVSPSAIENERSFIPFGRISDASIVLVSDRELTLPPGMRVVYPPAFQNAGFDGFGVTILPRTASAQAMVRVFNGTTRMRAILRVDQVKVPIDLPAAGQIRDYFVDLSTVGEVSEAELLSEDGRAWEDAVKGDNHAFLVRGGRPAKIDAAEGLSEDLRRMIGVYERRRGSSAESPRVRIVRGEPGDALAIVVPGIAPGDNGEAKIDAGHPITRSADLSAVSNGGRSTVPLAGDGWRVLIRAEDATPLLAIRETPARQVWVGFDSGVLADWPDYVVFWTDVFDWLAGAGGFSAEPVRGGLTPVRVADANLEASPGIYTDGVRQVATFMPAVRPTEAISDEPGVKPVAITQTQSLAAWPLAGAMLLLAIGLCLYRSLTRF